MDQIEVWKVKINTDRFREALGAIDELADSFTKHTQLQPIVLDGENELIAGYRRLCAAVYLKWETIGYVRKSGVSTVQRREMELEENIRRLQMDWQDEVKAIQEIHALREAEDETWTAVKTAEMIGKSPRLAQYAMELSQHLDDPVIASASTMKGAIQRLQSMKDIARRKAIVAHQAKTRRFEVIHGDCARVLQQLDSEGVDAIITNPPFGIDLDYKGTKPYSDEQGAVMGLLEDIIPELYRVLRPDSWLAMFFDIIKLFPWNPTKLEHLTDPALAKLYVCRPGIIQLLETAGFSVNVLPCMWIKPNKTHGTLRDPNTHLIMAYEAFVLARKGNAVLSRKGRQNIFIYDTPTPSERVHLVQMADDLSEELVGLLTIGGELVLDPFAGSCSVGVGAIRAQRNFLGIELDKESAARGEMRLKEELRHD